MVWPDEKDCLNDRRIANSLLLFTLDKYDDTFILFTLDDVEKFDYNNIDEDRLRVAYIDKNPYCYAYLSAIKDVDVLREVTDYVREYLYERYPVMEYVREVAKKLRETYGYDSKNNTSFYRSIP